MRKNQDTTGYLEAGLGKAGLFRGIYKLPGGISSQQRLELRSKHLHELALELEQAIQNDVPREFLCVYAWAVDALSAEIRLISDRLVSQGNSRKQNI